jgi:hypothetical protein
LQETLNRQRISSKKAFDQRARYLLLMQEKE